MAEETGRVRNDAMPGNPRYQPKGLIPYFGHDDSYRGPIEVELACLKTLGDIGVVPGETMQLLTPQLEHKLLTEITATEVDAVERSVTHHDIRALVRCMRDRMPSELGRWVHVPMTSYDALESGRALVFLKAFSEVTEPSIGQVVRSLTRVIRKHAETLMMGRTHGQHAMPITVGFWLATILSRLLYNWQQMDQYASHITGKISGAVGAYNAQVGLGIAERCGEFTFEQRVLDKLGLMPASISTQILPPEPLAYFLYSHVLMSAAIGQLGRDCRQLARSEIGEIAEPFGSKQSGSSTMAHKRNPFRLEGLEGDYFKQVGELQKVVLALISEGQRDLVGSRLMRDFPIIVINLQTQLDALNRTPKDSDETFLERLQICEEALERNFAQSAGLVISEPMYIALVMAGYDGDAHDLVNHGLTPFAIDAGVDLRTAAASMAQDDDELAAAWERIPTEVRNLFYHPERYCGLAAEKALEVVGQAERMLDELIG